MIYVWTSSENTAATKLALTPTPFASGGEGSLYHLATPNNYPNQVAKLYHANQRTELRYQKLLYLQEHRPKSFEAETLITLVWPEVLLFDEAGEFWGFLMPMASGEKLEVLCLPKLPKRHAENWKAFSFSADPLRRKRLNICYQLATAIAHIHATERYILIDMKPENIMIDPAGHLALVDLDSVEVVEHGETLYDAPVATPEYTPPDSYLSNNLVDPTQEDPWDRFGLGVIFYKLLLGVHPYAATGTGPYEGYDTLHEKIEHGLFVQHPEVQAHLSHIPAPHEAYHQLPAAIQQLFERCFIAGHHDTFQRPTAEEWAQALLEYQASRQLDEVRLPIPPLALPKLTQHTKLEPLYQQPTEVLASTAPKVELSKPVKVDTSLVLPSDIQEPAEIRAQRFFNFIVLLVLLVVGAALSILMPWPISLALGALAYLGFNYSTYKSRNTTEKKERLLSILSAQRKHLDDLMEKVESYEKKATEYIQQLKRGRTSFPQAKLSDTLAGKLLLQERVERFLGILKQEQQKLRKLRREERLVWQDLKQQYAEKIQATTQLSIAEERPIRERLQQLKRKIRLNLLSESQKAVAKADLKALEQLNIQFEVEQEALLEYYNEKTADLQFRCEQAYEQLLEDFDLYESQFETGETTKIETFLEEQRICLQELERLQYDIRQLEAPLLEQTDIYLRAQKNAALYDKVNYGRHLLEMLGLVKPF